MAGGKADLQVDLHHDIECPSTSKSAIDPVQCRLIRFIIMLNDSSPYPCSTEQCHDKDVGIFGPLVQSETSPIQKTAEENIGRDLREGGDERRKCPRSRTEVKGEVGTRVGEQESRVKEEWDTNRCNLLDACIKEEEYGEGEAHTRRKSLRTRILRTSLISSNVRILSGDVTFCPSLRCTLSGGDKRRATKGVMHSGGYIMSKIQETCEADRVSSRKATKTM